MGNLTAQWDTIVERQAPDWSHLSIELTLTDDERSEQAVVIMAPLNPWRRDDDFRSGDLRFRSARTSGYGAAAQLVRMRLSKLDEAGIEGSLRLLGALDELAQVGTQGPR